MKDDDLIEEMAKIEIEEQKLNKKHQDELRPIRERQRKELEPLRRKRGEIERKRRQLVQDRVKKLGGTPEE